MKHLLKFYSILFFLMLSCSLLNAQKHFLYVQSEDKQPFAIVLSGKVYSSSDYGYVILPKLTDGKYDFTVSFPLTKFPDQSFSCTINKKDEGYILKNGAQGWALENLQTQKSLINTTADVAKKNAFGDMLSDVVSDSSLNKKILPPADTIATNTTVTGEPILKPEKISQTALDTGTNMQFVDKNAGAVDTVSVFIPAETIPASSSSVEQSAPTLNADTIVENKPASLPPTTSNASNNVLTDTSTHEPANPFYKPTENSVAANASSPVSSENTTVTNTNATGAVRQDCENTLSDDDLSKLQRKMFSHSDDQSMIQYALKYLNKKCITTDQVKSLGRLFSSDDGRYNLYDALYLHTSDYGNYSSLASQIIDPYYKKRFTALLR